MSKEFENSFREKFQNFESEVSPDLFDKIVSARNSKRRGAWFFSNRMIWSAAALLLIGLSTILYFTMGEKEQVNTDNRELVNQEIVQEDSRNQEFNNSELSGDNDQPLENETEVSSETEVLSNESSERVVSNNDRDRSRSITRPTVDERNDEDRNTTDVATEDGNLEVDDETEVTIDPPIVDNRKPKVDNISADDSGSEDEANLLNETPQDPNPKNPMVLENDINDGESTGGQTSPDKKEDKDDPDGPYGPKTNFSFDVYVGPGETYRDLLTTNTEWQNARNRAESSLLGVQVGIGINYNLNQDKTWKISSGIRMTQARIGFNHANTWNTYDTSYSKREITVINPPPIGPTIVTITDTNVTAVPHEDRFKATNTIFSLRVPLELERSFHIGTNWTVLAKAGVTYSFMSQRSGYSLNAAGEIIPQEQLSINRYSAWNSVWAAGLAYRVNQNLSVIAYPHFNYAFGRTYTQNAGINEREYGIYTHFGIRIDL
ncbi:hypothetical protein GYB29_05495 [bacterium]|nr:hypothetical protein [bacterium]